MIYLGQARITEKLINKKANINLANQPVNPLYWAIRFGKLNIKFYVCWLGWHLYSNHKFYTHTDEFNALKLLVQNGASVNIKNSEGKTPLDESIELGNYICTVSWKMKIC